VASSQASAPAIPRLALAPLVKAIGDPLRWEILRQLASGEPRMVVEIAGALRKSPTLISKHLVWLREAGAVEKGRAQLYTIPRRFLPSPGDGVVDFGHCLLRMGRQA
jgi:DNA-binding transcriptional ArsR family regulator